MRRFFSSDAGGVAIMCALLLGILAVIAGSAIDLWRASYARTTLQNALDNALLAAAKRSMTDHDAISEELHRFFNANPSLSRELASLDIDIDVYDDRLYASATANIPTSLLKIIGQDILSVGVTSEAKRGAGRMEISLVLDVTGSMENHMPALREAASSLVNLVMDTAGNDPDRIRIALVPYVGTVNIGTGAEQMSWMDVNGNSRHHGAILEQKFIGTRMNAGCGEPPTRPGAPHMGNPKQGGLGHDADASEHIPMVPRATLAELQRNAERLLGMDEAQAQGVQAYQPRITPDGCHVYNPDQINYFRLYDMMANDHWRGCVESRPEPFDITDEPPSAANPDTLFVPWMWVDNMDSRFTWGVPDQINSYAPDHTFVANANRFIYNGVTYSSSWWERTFSVLKYHPGMVVNHNYTPPHTHGPNKACPDPIVPLTSNRTQLLNAIGNLSHWHGSGTNTVIGLAWGWRTLSPRPPFTQGRDYGDAKKIIVLMTDGKNNVIMDENDEALLSHNLSYGYFKEWRTRSNNFDQYSQYVDGRLTRLCNNAKSAGSASNQDVVIFTITFGLADPYIHNLYRNCASSPQFAYNTYNAGDLQMAFESIAHMVTQLHLSR